MSRIVHLLVLASMLGWASSFPAPMLGQETEVVNEAEGKSEIVFEPTSEGAAAARSENPPRSVDADEPIDFNAKRPSILGMTVAEDDDGLPRVVDVGATSPAWDAGIRKGDVIVALHGVREMPFQEWAEHVRKVVADTKAGESIPVQVQRDGTSIDLVVRASEQKGNRAPRLERTPGLVRNQAAATGEQPTFVGGAPYPAPGGAVGAVGGIIGDDGVPSDQMPVRAVAQLMAVNNRARTAQPPTVTNPVGPTNAAGVGGGPGGAASGTFPPNTANEIGGQPPALGTAPAPTQPAAKNNASTPQGHVGVAEFVDDSNATNAVVNLTGLLPGTYRVGIGQLPGEGSLQSFPTNMPRDSIPDRHPNRPNARNGRSTSGLRPGENAGAAVPQNNQPKHTPNAVPASGAPAESGDNAQEVGNGGAELGRDAGSGASFLQPRQNISGQVAPRAAGGSVEQNPIGPRQHQNPGQGPSIDSAHARQAEEENRRFDQKELQRRAVQQPAMAPQGSQFGINLGMITIGPNGSGSLQQRLAGIRVASIIGQSVLVATAGSPIAGSATDFSATNRAQGRQNFTAEGAANQGQIDIVATGVINVVPTTGQKSFPQTSPGGVPVPGVTQGTSAAAPATTSVAPPRGGQQAPQQTSERPANGNQQ